MRYGLVRLHPQRRRSRERAGVLRAPRPARAAGGVRRPGTRRSDLAERSRGNARGRHRHLDRKAEEARRRDAAARRQGITLNCQGSCPYVLGGIKDGDVDDAAGEPLEKVREIVDA
jgi:hypothetical protein